MTPGWARVKQDTSSASEDPAGLVLTANCEGSTSSGRPAGLGGLKLTLFLVPLVLARR